MNRSDTITRLRAADPAAGREPVVDPSLIRARVEAIRSSTGSDAPAPVTSPRARSRRTARVPRIRRAVVLSVAALALPGAALATTALFGAEDVERGLPDGAKLLNGSDPKCTEVDAAAVYDCTLTRPPRDMPGGLGEPGHSWRNAVSLMADRDERVNGGCVAQTDDGMRWRCYVGRAAVEQWILDARVLGTPIHDECVDPVGPKPGESSTPTPDPAPATSPPDGLSPGAGPTSDQSSHGIFLCAIRGTLGAAIAVPNPPHPFTGPPKP